jgi:DDE family transposase
VKKNVTGRQLARVSAVNYRETIWSELYPGNRHTVTCLQPAVLASESALELAPEQHKRVVWRMDGGAGSDDELRWLLARQYQVVAKGASNRRAEMLAKQVKRWDVYHDAWLGEVVSPIDFGRPVQVFVKKRVKNGEFVHSYYVSTLKLPSKGRLMSYYDARGGAEVEQFRNDKGGLQLEARRKRSFVAQKALILLTDLAHNLLADFQRHALTDSKFASFGLKRIVRDLFQIPGRLVFDGTQLKRIDLLASHPHAKDLLICLEKYCALD